MPNIQEDILGGFLERLSKLDEIDEAMVTALRELLSPENPKKVNAGDLVDVFTRKSERDLR